MRKRCGNCQFIIGRIYSYNAWLCDKLDLKVDVDSGKNCKHWTGRKYDRNKEKQQGENEVLRGFEFDAVWIDECVARRQLFNEEE